MDEQGAGRTGMTVASRVMGATQLYQLAIRKYPTKRDVQQFSSDEIKPSELCWPPLFLSTRMYVNISIQPTRLRMQLHA